MKQFNEAYEKVQSQLSYKTSNVDSDHSPPKLMFSKVNHVPSKSKESIYPLSYQSREKYSATSEL